jgi:hypothetical protein
MRFLFATLSLPLALSTALIACGSDVNGTGGGTTSTSSSGGGATTSTTTSTTSTGSGGAPHGDCKTDADCGGKTCAPLTAGGYLVCLDPIAEATSCDSSGPPNECCSSKDCAASGGSCYPAAQLDFCGGAFPGFNRCVADGCQSDADCTTGAICAPAGAFGFPKRFCLNAYCHTDADCNAKAGGVCAPIGFNPCCSLKLPSGLGCAYPGGCQKDADCPSGNACTLDLNTGVGVCMPNGPGCPP